MRIRVVSLLTALLLGSAAGVRAQVATASQTSDAPLSGSVDFGAQFTTTDGDEARYQRYQDLRDGPLVNAFKYVHDKDKWHFDLFANHVGYRDQKYVAKVNNLGRVKVNFTWDQIPTFYSTEDTDSFGALSATAYRGVGTGQYHDR